jgi:hypothetical protein
MQRIMQGGREIARALLPAAGGRVNLFQVMSQPRRILELFPLVAASSSVFAAVAATAWRAEELAGITGGDVSLHPPFLPGSHLYNHV